MVTFLGSQNVQKLKAKHDVQRLIEILKNERYRHLRLSAAIALGEIGDPIAAIPLIVALRDTSSDIAEAAAIALGNIADPRAIKPLIEVLDGSLWPIIRNFGPNVPPFYNLKQVQSAACRALVKIGPTAVVPLIEKLSTGNEIFYDSIIKTLGEIGDSRAITPLITFLKEYGLNREAAVKALALLGKPAIKPLIGILKHKDPRLRSSAAEVLGMIGDEETVSFLKFALEDTDPVVRLCSLKALGQIEGLSDTFEGLIDLLKSDYLDVRVAAAEKLALVGDSRAIEPLISALKYFFEPNNPIVAAIKKLEPPTELLIAALSDKFSGIRRGAAELLIPINDPKAIEPLILALSDETPFVCEAAAEALEKYNDKRVIDSFILALRNPCISVRSIAIRVLDTAGYSPENDEEVAVYYIAKKQWDSLYNELGIRAVEPLIAALSYDEIDFQKSAAFYLGWLKDSRAVKPLIECLGSNDPKVRAVVADALGDIGDPSAIKPLLRSLSDPYQEFYHTVRKEYGIYG